MAVTKLHNVAIDRRIPHNEVPVEIINQEHGQNDDRNIPLAFQNAIQIRNAIINNYFS